MPSPTLEKEEKASAGGINQLDKETSATPPVGRATADVIGTAGAERWSRAIGELLLVALGCRSSLAKALPAAKPAYYS